MKQRTNFIVPAVEDYVCEHCGQVVTGGRYNNHCPGCLWSKHVDNKLPGDRAASCHGLMEPVGVMQKADKLRLVHVCTRCGKGTVTDAASDDNTEVLIELSRRPVDS